MNLFLKIAGVIGAFFTLKEVYKLIVKPTSASPAADNENETTDAGDIDAIIEKYIDEYNDSGLDLPEIEVLVNAIIQIESSGRNIAHPDGVSFGLMGVTLETAQWIMNDRSITNSMLLNPEFNLRCGIKYLCYQLERYDSNDQAAIIAFHLGSNPYIDYSLFSNNLESARQAADKYWNSINAEISRINNIGFRKFSI